MNEMTPGFTQVGKDELALFGTEPLSVVPYHDPDYFEAEREAIFRKTWLHIGHVSELPSSPSFIVRDLEVVNASALITRGREGELRAFHNICTHRGTRLVVEDSGTRAKFSCRYHMWTYGSDGALLNAPDLANFYNLDKADCGLTPLALDVVAGFIFVNLDANPAQPLREFLGPLADRLEELAIGHSTDFYEYTYDAKANWKTAFDNFQELYHARFIHGKTLGGRVTGAANPFGYPSDYQFMGPHRSMQLWFNPTYSPQTVEGLVGRMTTGGDSSHLVAVNEYIGIFPNLFILPRKLGGFTQTIIPIGPSRSRSIIRVYASGPNDKASTLFAREFAFTSLLDVHAEDLELIEASQFGLENGAIKHVHFQSQEVACRHLYKTVDGIVSDYRQAKQEQPA